MPEYTYKPAESAILAKCQTVGQAIPYMAQGALSADAFQKWCEEREAKAAATQCPFADFAAFAAAAASEDVQLSLSGGDKAISGKVKEFDSGSFGYNVTGKITLKIGGKPVKFQVGANLVAIGSKPEAAAAKKKAA